MRVSCPSCQTDYDVPDAALAGRTRTLRCASCGSQWQAGPLPSSPPPIPEPAIAQREYAEPPRPATGTEPTPAETFASPVIAQTLPTATHYPPEYAPEPAYRAPPPELIDPAEARHNADRESFAALIEASRQSHAQNPELDEQKSHKSRRSLNPLVISVLVLLLAIGLIYLERNHIMAVWPASARLFTLGRS